MPEHEDCSNCSKLIRDRCNEATFKDLHKPSGICLKDHKMRVFNRQECLGCDMFRICGPNLDYPHLKVHLK